MSEAPENREIPPDEEIEAYRGAMERLITAAKMDDPPIEAAVKFAEITLEMYR